MFELGKIVDEHQKKGFTIVIGKPVELLAGLYERIELLGYLPKTNSRVVACKKLKPSMFNT